MSMEEKIHQRKQRIVQIRDWKSNNGTLDEEAISRLSYLEALLEEVENYSVDTEGQEATGSLQIDLEETIKLVDRRLFQIEHRMK